MSNDTVSINERAFNEAIIAWLAAVWLLLVDETVKIAPRDYKRLPINTIDRKDGKAPIRRTGRRPIQIFGHWYEWVTGNLKQSIAHGIDERWYKVMVGISSSGPAANYAGILEDEYGTAGKRARPFLRPTIQNKEIQSKLIHEFERAFYTVLEKYNR